jgi:formylglycine-generating enzyme required for sulfatase activity
MKKLCLIAALTFNAALMWSQDQADAEAEQTRSSDFVLVSPGTFEMESGEIQAEISKAFYISDHEVTQREWVEAMGENPSRFRGEDLPVESVSWYDAVEYCNKRSEREGLTPAYKIDKTRKDRNNESRFDHEKWVVTWDKGANGYRLPTEAEWEAAARGGGQDGEGEYSGVENVGEAAWYWNNSEKRTHRVKTKAANGLGLYDMSGNVFEWCWDWRGSYAEESQTDPEGGDSGAVRIVRGGCWFSSERDLRSAAWGVNTPSIRVDGVGFRLVRSEL